MTHLELLNALLALRLQQPGWPQVLATCEFMIQSIGVSFRIDEDTLVSPDVLATAFGRNLTVLFEVKGGHSVDGDQLRRMKAVRPEDLRDFAHVRIDNPKKHRIVVAYFCNEADSEATAGEVDDAVVVIGFDGSRFSLRGSELTDQCLRDQLLAARIPPGLAALPVIAFDQDSPPAQVAESIAPAIVQSLVLGVGTLSIDGVLQQTHGLVIDSMRSTGVGSELQAIRKVARRIVREAARNEFRPWLESVPNQDLWRIGKPLSTDAATKARELRALRKAASDLAARLGGSGGLQLTFEETE